MTKKLSVAPAAASVSDAKLKAIKAEEASIMTRLDSLKRELGKAEEMRTQQAELAEQVNSLRQQQTEENTKLEELKREVMELGSQLEQRRQLLEAPPDERQAQLTQQDRELLQKIIDHKKEELALAKKIQEIRRKVVELEKRTKA
jgi:chromosome segregation ATPase